MGNLPLFWVAAVTALAIENAVFARALGLNRTILFLESPKKGILYGVLLTWMAVISSMLVSAFNVILADAPYISFIRAPVFLLCVVIVYAATYWLTRLKFEKLHDMVRHALPVSTFNSALFGVFYVATNQQYVFFQTLGYAFGAGVGYTLAILVVYYARKRLSISPVPRSFRGLPILLVYLGLLSLAIYGLIGHALPA